MLLTDTPPENMTAKGHENHTGIGHFESIQKKNHDTLAYKYTRELPGNALVNISNW